MEQTMSALDSLPYDLLLNIAQNLDLYDVQALQMTCRTLYDFSISRHVYRNLAYQLLRRCRALPLTGFQRISDLSTPQLAQAVKKAVRLEHAWLTRTPRPSYSSPYLVDKNKSWYKVVSAPPNEEVDWLSPITSSYSLCATKSGKVVCWDVQRDVCLAEWDPEEKWELWKCRVEFEDRTVFFTMAKIIGGMIEDRIMQFVLMKLEFPRSPPGQNWVAKPVFSEIANFRTVGFVINVFLLEPALGLLAAFIFIASTNSIGLYVLPNWSESEYIFVDTGLECSLSGNWSCILHEDHIVIHSEESNSASQHFYPLSLLRQHTQLSSQEPGWVPKLSGRLQSAYAITRPFKFPKFGATFISDTLLGPLPEGMQPLGAHNFGPHGIQVHVGGAPDAANGLQIQIQVPNVGIVPYNLTNQNQPVQGQNPNQPNLNQVQVVGALNHPTAPIMITIVNGPTTVNGQAMVPNGGAIHIPQGVIQGHPALPQLPIHPITLNLHHHNAANPISVSVPGHNPFPFPPWSPESAHFVRQWWPTLPGVPKFSCTVALLSFHDMETHRDCYVLAQHYFNVPLAETISEAAHGGSASSSAKECTTLDDDLMRMWYVSSPFEIVCVLDTLTTDLDDLGEGMDEARRRPLIAVDFGHAVWVEYDPDAEQDDMENGMDFSGRKRLRFVSFAPIEMPGERAAAESRRSSSKFREAASRIRGTEGVVRTLEVPEELDLDSVETINIDQSQGTVILSVKEGKIFILCYE